MTVLFCLSLGLGGGGASPDRPWTHILSRGKPDVKPLRLYFWRVVIQSSGQGGSASPFPSIEHRKRAPGWSRAAPAPSPRARADKAGTDDDPRGRRPATRQQEQGIAAQRATGAPETRDAPRHTLPSPPQRTGGHFAAAPPGALARRELPPRESRNDKKAGTNDHHPARHLGGVGIKSRQRPHPSQGTLVPASRRPHPPNDDAAANSRAERRATPERESPPQRMAATTMTAARLLDIGTVFRQNMSEKLFRSEIDAKHFADEIVSEWRI